VGGRRLRVLEVTESLGAGVLTVLLELCAGLDPAVFQVTLVYSSRPGAPSRHELARDFGPHVELVEIRGTRSIDPLRDLVTFARYVRLFRRVRPDVVHLHSSKAGFLGRIAARLAGIRNVFYSPQGLSFLRSDVSGMQQAAYRRLERFAARWGGTVVSASRSEAAALKGVVSEDRLVVVENGVDVGALDRIVAGSGGTSKRSDVERHVGPRIVGTAGRMSWQKDPIGFLEVAHQLHEAYGETVEFLWIGDGEMREEVEARSRSLGLDDVVRITGWLDRTSALRLLARDVDIYLQTSRWEGMPLVLIETMVLGKPIVARDVVGSRDVVENGTTGFLGEGTEELVERCGRLLDRLDLAERMGRAARARAESRFSSRLLCERTARLYREAVSGRGQPVGADGREGRGAAGPRPLNGGT